MVSAPSSNVRYSRYFTYIQPVLKSPIVKTYGTYTLTFFTMAIFIIFAIKPTIETIIVLQKKIEDSNLVLEKINKKSEDLSLGKQNYQALDPTIRQKINMAVPDTLSLKTLIQSLEQAANTNQASISALQVQPVTIESKDPNSVSTALGEIEFTFNIEGSYNTLLTVLKQIQSSTRLISIENLLFNKALDGNILLLSVTGKAYYLK